MNGQFDFHTEEELEQYYKQVEETGDPSIPLMRSEESTRARYVRTANNEVIMEIKDKIIDICKLIMNFQNNMRLSMFLNEFANFENKRGESVQKYCMIY